MDHLAALEVQRHLNRVFDLVASEVWPPTVIGAVRLSHSLLAEDGRLVSVAHVGHVRITVQDSLLDLSPDSVTALLRRQLEAMREKIVEAKRETERESKVRSAKNLLGSLVRAVSIFMAPFAVMWGIHYIFDIDPYAAEKRLEAKLQAEEFAKYCHLDKEHRRAEFLAGLHSDNRRWYFTEAGTDMKLVFWQVVSERVGCSFQQSSGRSQTFKTYRE